MKEKELSKGNFIWSWDDDNMLGDFTIDCPCGKKTKPTTIEIYEDNIECECGRIFRVERMTKVFFSDI